jgi:hypothetical protein
MLSEAKHPHTGFLAEARNDTKKRSGMNKKACGMAEKSTWNTKDKCGTMQQN